MLEAMRTASIATSIKVPQVVRNGGPPDVRDAVTKLGQAPSSKDKFPIMQEPLSIKINNKPVVLIAKPSNVSVPPWQMVSALLSGVSARAATWWTKPKIDSTLASTTNKCMDKAIKDGAIKGKAGPVAIALTGEWKKSSIKLYAPSNHAKIGVATSGNNTRYEIFGDLNQQGSLSPPPDCDASQNGRGGMFFVLQRRQAVRQPARSYSGRHRQGQGELARACASDARPPPGGPRARPGCRATLLPAASSSRRWSRR